MKLNINIITEFQISSQMLLNSEVWTDYEKRLVKFCKNKNNFDYDVCFGI